MIGNDLCLVSYELVSQMLCLCMLGSSKCMCVCDADINRVWKFLLHNIDVFYLLAIVAVCRIQPFFYFITEKNFCAACIL